MIKGMLARAALAAAASLLLLGGARAHAAALPGATDRVLVLVNQQRAQAGLAPLALDPQLTAASQKYSDYMASANFYAHEGPDGSTPSSRISASGFPGNGTWGENIAAYYSDADAVMQVWMASPGHRSNILNPAFTHIGIGVGYNPNSQWKYYWTQDFAVRVGGGSAFGGASGGPIGSVPQPQPQAQPPILSSLSPAQGSAGQTIKLTGQNFGNTQGTVSFSGMSAQVQSWSNTQIQAQVPAGASSGAVYVQNALGTSHGVQFTVVATAPNSMPSPVAAPQATYIYPGAGNAGVRVTVYGRGFGLSAGQVLFNGVPGQVAYWYDTLIGVNVPAGATSGPVIVHAAGGNANALSFTVYGGDATATQPQLTFCSPSAGAVGSQVSVLGRNLGSTPGSVTFHGVAASVVNWTASAIVAIVPQGATSGPVTVQTGGGISNSVTFTVVVPGQAQPPPTPYGGNSSPGTGSGSNQGTSSSPFSWLYPRRTVTPAPAPQPAPAPTGSTPTGSNGTAAGSSPSFATLPASGLPVALTLAPASASPGASLTIGGSGFGSTRGSVRVGHTGALILSWTDRAITVQVPLTVGTAGRISVTVLRPDFKMAQPLYLQLTP